MFCAGGFLLAACSSSSSSSRSDASVEAGSAAPLDLDLIAALFPPENAASDDVIGEGQFVGVPMNDAFQFGRGLNEVTLEILPGTMAMAAIPTEKNIQSNNAFDYYFHVISQVDDLVDALSINAELDLNMNMISGTAYGSYINDVEKHANSVFALITVEAKTYYYDITGLAFANAGADPSTYYPACNTPAQHLGDARYQYLCDYNAFSEIYGHRYLSGIQAGGRYVGLMRIDATSASSARDIAVDVKGRYNNGAINISLKGAFSDHVASMARKYNASFKVFTTGAAFDMPPDAKCNATTGGTAGSDVTQGGTGCANGYLIDNPEKFFTYANQFVEVVLAKDGVCKNKDRAWQECAYTASFADYSAIAGEARDAAKKARLNQASKLMAYYRQYKKLNKKAADIYAHNLDYLYEYTIFNFDTFADETITVRPDITGIVSGYATRAMEILAARYAECLQGITCAMPLFNEARKMEIYAPSRMEAALPIPAQLTPLSCYDWQKTTGKNGNWALIQREDGTSERYRILCENMSTNDPETYLDLTNNNSPSAASPTVNYSMWENADQSTTTTIFKHLRIHPNVGKISLVQGQDLWTETLVYPEAVPVSGGGDGGVDSGDDAGTSGTGTSDMQLTRFKQALAGKAADCFPVGVTSIANLDLGNIPLRFADEVTFEGSLRSNYRIGAETATWEVANANAKAAGGHLLRIDSPQEWIEVVRLLGDAVGSNGQYWVDLKFEDSKTTTADVTTTNKFAYKWGGVVGYDEITTVDCNNWMERTVDSSSRWLTTTKVITDKIYEYCTNKTVMKPIFDVWEENWPQPYLESQTVTTTTTDTFTRCAYYNAATGALRDDACLGYKDNPNAGKRLYIIEFDYDHQPLYAVTWGAGRKSVTITVNAENEGRCVDVHPSGPLWLVPIPAAESTPRPPQNPGDLRF